jgi:hypothetical protein
MGNNNSTEKSSATTPRDSGNVNQKILPYRGAVTFEGVDFFPSDKSHELLSTTYGSQIKLIDEGRLLNQFTPRVLEILKKVKMTEPDGKMLTFCITVYDCEIKIVSLSAVELSKNTIDNYRKLNDSRRLLIIKHLEEITLFLIEKKKELGRENICPSGVTRNIYSKILSLLGTHQEIELKIKDALDLFNVMDGLLFQGQTISPIVYRLAISGFGDDSQFDRLRKALEKLAYPISPVSKQASHSLPSVSTTVQPDDISPDDDKLTVFRRFLVAATGKIEKDISSVEHKYQVFLNEDQKNELKNIKNLFLNAGFKDLLTEFNESESKSMSHDEFLLEFMFKYEVFDYLSYFNQHCTFNQYAIPTSASGISNDELEQYRVKKLSTAAIFPTYDKRINSLADQCSVTLKSINSLYQLFSSTSAVAMAAKSAHCAEDVLLLYMKEYPEQFTAENSSTYIFSVPIEKRNCQDIVNIQARCEVCKIHFNHDLCHILNIAEEDVLTKFETSSQSDSSSCLSKAEKELLHSTGVYGKFSTLQPAVFHALSDNHRNDGKSVIFAAGEEECSALIKKTAQAYCFRKEHKSHLLQNAARGKLDEIRSLLEKAKHNEKQLSKMLHEKNDDDGNTALHYAAMINIHDNPETMCQIILLLLESGGDPTIRNKNDENVLVVFMNHLDYDFQENIFSQTKGSLEAKCLSSNICTNDFNNLKLFLPVVMPDYGNRQAFLHRGMSDIILTKNHGKSGSNYGKVFSNAMECNDVPEINSTALDLSHFRTISDGNDAFNAVALGLLFHRNTGIDLFTGKDEFRETFSEVFDIPKQLLSQENFSLVIDVLTSYDINLSNPVIISILNALESVPDVCDGDQLNQRIMALRGINIADYAYEEGSYQIKRKHREAAILGLVYFGEIYQLAMSLVLRRCYVKYHSQVIPLDCWRETLKTTNKFGEFVGPLQLSFLAQYFNVRISEKQEEFGKCLIHNSESNHELSIICLHPGQLDCQYKLDHPADS